MRRRYLALKSECTQSFDKRDVMDAIWGMVYQLFGELGASRASLSSVKGFEVEGVMVVRCSHRTLDMVRAAIAAVTEINGKSAVIRVVGVSGTLKGLRKRLLKQQA